MKTLFFSVIIFFYSLSSFSQTNTSCNSDCGGRAINCDINELYQTNLNYDLSMSGTGNDRINISGGKLKFINLRDGQNIRAFRSVGSLLDNGWKVTFSFIDSTNRTGNNQDVGHAILGFTAGSLNPYNNFPNQPNPSNQDAIWIDYSTTSVNNSPSGVSRGLRIGFNDSGVIGLSSNFISINPFTLYFMTLERISSDRASLFVYSDNARTTLIGSIPCFTIPPTIVSLNTLMHSTQPSGSSSRILNGAIDDVCISNQPRFSPCEIKGLSTINASLLPLNYSTTNTNGNCCNWKAVDAQGNLIPQITIVQNGNNCTITSLGGYSQSFFLSNDCCGCCGGRFQIRQTLP